MEYILERIIWNKDLYIPFIIVFVAWIIFVCCRKNQSDEVKGGMLKTCLLLFPVSIIWVVIYLLVRLIIGSTLSYGVVSGIIGIIAGIVVNALCAAAVHRYFNSKCLEKNKRIISIIVLFILCSIEMIITVEILSGCMT